MALSRACMHACMTGGLDPQPTGGLGLEWAAVNEDSVGKCARLGIPADLVLQWLVRCVGAGGIPTTVLKVNYKAYYGLIRCPWWCSMAISCS